MKSFKRIMKAALSTLLIVSVLYFADGYHQESNAQAKESYIVIKKGDTLYSIAKQYDTTVQKLKEYNHLNSNMIYVGQKLLVSNTTHSAQLYIVMAGSFTKKIHADNRVSLLKQKDIDAVIVKKVINNKRYYRIQVGVFLNKENAENQEKRVKLAGITDAYTLSSKLLHINGITLGNSYNELVQQFGKPINIEEQFTIKSLFYMNEGAGVRVKLNMADGIIDQLQIYPEYLAAIPVPNEKKEVIEVYGYPNEIEKVSCYESAICEQLIYQFNRDELTVQIDRDGKSVQFFELKKIY